MFKIKLTPKAKRQLKKLSKEEKLSIGEIIEELKENPFIGKTLERELSGRFVFKFKAYRIIYKVNLKDNIVDILDADHRGKIYN